jgi:hypothetical protein
MKGIGISIVNNEEKKDLLYLAITRYSIHSIDSYFK